MRVGSVCLSRLVLGVSQKMSLSLSRALAGAHLVALEMPDLKSKRETKDLLRREMLRISGNQIYAKQGLQSAAPPAADNDLRPLFCICPVFAR